MSFVGKFTPQIKQKFIEGSGDDDIIIVGIPFGICRGGGFRVPTQPERKRRLCVFAQLKPPTCALGAWGRFLRTPQTDSPTPQ